jgi:hypothetical protein
MGTNPGYTPGATDEWIDRPKLETWQKVVLGAISVAAAGVILAPVAITVGQGCLAAAPVCAAEIAEAATGGASGGSAVVGAGAVAGTTGLARRTTNTGVFSKLQVPMQKRVVNEVAAKAGVGLDGVKVKINRDSDLIGRNFYGHTSPDGTITLYPDAFSSTENLVKTLGHERMHVMQTQVFGKASSIEQEAAWEKAAYAAEEQFWNLYNGKLE